MVSALDIRSTKIELGFKALSDPLRIRILELLREQEFCVCDLSSHLDVGQSKLSFHLKVLKEAELLRSRQQGKWIYYSLNLPQFAVLEQYLSEFRRFSPMLSSRVCSDSESASESAVEVDG
jgi:ArsR family transcriptional regulator